MDAMGIDCASWPDLGFSELAGETAFLGIARVLRSRGDRCVLPAVDQRNDDVLRPRGHGCRILKIRTVDGNFTDANRFPRLACPESK